MTVAPGGEKLTRVGQEVEEDLPQPFAVGDEAADIGGRPDVEHQSRAHQAVLHALGRRAHGFADVDRSEIEVHAAGIDSGQIENVVDQRQQRVR